MRSWGNNGADATPLSALHPFSCSDHGNVMKKLDKADYKRPALRQARHKGCRGSGGAGIGKASKGGVSKAGDLFPWLYMKGVGMGFKGVRFGVWKSMYNTGGTGLLLCGKFCCIGTLWRCTVPECILHTAACGINSADPVICFALFGQKTKKGAGLYPSPKTPTCRFAVCPNADKGASFCLCCLADPTASRLGQPGDLELCPIADKGA